MIGIVRARLQAKLALVQAATAMPSADHLAIIREDNGVRHDKDRLPPEDGAELRAAFNAGMGRLQAVMNAGPEADSGD